ncbi:hypothetical protein AB0D46_13995 [Streptomyces sp. NPDC048383]|uniref:hypothetical protein n=1 Tax=Streptomyces sp. NPDC048383 TaxID=3155386 RepID=UPI00344A2010
MSRLELPYLVVDRTLLSLQDGAELVEPEDGKVYVSEYRPPWLLGGWRTNPDRFFPVRTPRPNDAPRGFRFSTTGRPLLVDTDGDSCLVPCTAQACRRWVEAAVAYATAVDGVSAELVAANHRARSVPRWRRFAAPLALRNWQKARQRYERVMQEAGEAYKPIRQEIAGAMWIEKEKAGERARQAHRRKAALAERPLWGWSMATNGRPTAYVFRHDVPAGDGIAPTSPQMNPPVDLPGLRQALNDLKPVQLQWDRTAITQTERELESVSFETWWRELFYEDYRTFTLPPSGRSSSSREIGGTGTSGTGGYGGY